MNHDEIAQTLKLFIRRRPFKTFQIELISGDRFAVGHPEAIRPGQNLFLHISPDRLTRVFEASAVVQFLDEPRSNP